MKSDLQTAIAEVEKLADKYAPLLGDSDMELSHVLILIQDFAGVLPHLRTLLDELKRREDADRMGDWSKL